ncbi:hypothetical protein [Photobacterium leiognathi]|uniref:hypothetical protein n=1 Tax=Photobacterium leiognathi TaxID=553611 RepID=UPI002739691E|nr:hypothetical protein [Photobacterium leiognathi]
MGNEYLLSFEVIRVRCQILEALMSDASFITDKASLHVCSKTADVIENIAQDALSGSVRIKFLRVSLEAALFLLNKYHDTLARCHLHVPSVEQIQNLIKKLEIENKI